MAELSQTLALQLGQLQTQRERYANAPVESFAGEYSPSGEYIGRNPAALKAATVAYYERQIQQLKSQLEERKAYEQTPAYQAEQRGFAEQQPTFELGDVKQQYLTREGEKAGVEVKVPFGFDLKPVLQSSEYGMSQEYTPKAKFYDVLRSGQRIETPPTFDYSLTPSQPQPTYKVNGKTVSADYATRLEKLATTKTQLLGEELGFDFKPTTKDGGPSVNPIPFGVAQEPEGQDPRNEFFVTQRGKNLYQYGFAGGLAAGIAETIGKSTLLTKAFVDKDVGAFSSIPAATLEFATTRPLIFARAIFDKDLATAGYGAGEAITFAFSDKILASKGPVKADVLNLNIGGKTKPIYGGVFVEVPNVIKNLFKTQEVYNVVGLTETNKIVLGKPKAQDLPSLAKAAETLPVYGGAQRYGPYASESKFETSIIASQPESLSMLGLSPKEQAKIGVMLEIKDVFGLAESPFNRPLISETKTTPNPLMTEALRQPLREYKSNLDRTYGSSLTESYLSPTLRKVIEVKDLDFKLNTKDLSIIKAIQEEQIAGLRAGGYFEGGRNPVAKGMASIEEKGKYAYTDVHFLDEKINPQDAFPSLFNTQNIDAYGLKFVQKPTTKKTAAYPEGEGIKVSKSSQQFYENLYSGTGRLYKRDGQTVVMFAEGRAKDVFRAYVLGQSIAEGFSGARKVQALNLLEKYKKLYINEPEVKSLFKTLNKKTDAAEKIKLGEELKPLEYESKGTSKGSPPAPQAPYSTYSLFGRDNLKYPSVYANKDLKGRSLSSTYQSKAERYNFISNYGYNRITNKQSQAAYLQSKAQPVYRYNYPIVKNNLTYPKQAYSKTQNYLNKNYAYSNINQPANYAYSQTSIKTTPVYPPQPPSPNYGKPTDDKVTSKLKRRLGRGFIALSKRRGKWFALNQTPVPFGEALAKAQSFVTGTLAASFKVIQAGVTQEREGPATSLSNQFRPSKRDANVFVQKRGYRLGSQMERKEIQQARRRLI